MDTTTKIKKKCKYPSCRKFVTNLSTTDISQMQLCCSIHEEKCITFPKPDECPICTEPFKLNIPLFPCYHWICVNCVIESGKQECPICRQFVLLGDDDIKKINKREKEMKKEKERIQLEEDRKLAEQLQREERPLYTTINTNFNQVQPLRINVNPDNYQEIIGVLHALSPHERIQMTRNLVLHPNLFHYRLQQPNPNMLIRLPPTNYVFRENHSDVEENEESEIEFESDIEEEN